LSELHAYHPVLVTKLETNFTKILNHISSTSNEGCYIAMTRWSDCRL